MKKVLLILSFTFLFFFIFLPNDVKAYTISSDIIEEEITCNSDDDEYCKSLGYKYAYYYNDAYLDGNNGSYYILTNSTLWFAPAYQSSVEVGPPTTYPSYIYKLGSGNSLQYSFEKGKIYRVYYNFRFPKKLTLSMGNSSFMEEYASFEVSDGDNTYKDWSKIFERYAFGFLEPDENESTEPFEFTFYFEFEPIIDFNSLKFSIGTDHFNNNYHREFISNPWTSGTGSNQTTSSNITYLGIRVVETNDFLSFLNVNSNGIHWDIDEVSDADKSIFDNLDTCEALDFGCHFNNLITLIKNTFTRIGNFFLDVLNFFNNFFTWLGDLLTEYVINPLKELLINLFVPDNESLQSLYDTVSNYFSNKLGFLLFPFDLIVNFLNKFLSIPNEPVKVITVPSVSLGSFGTLIKGFTFNIAEYWEKAPFKQIYDVYLVFIHAFIGFGLYKLCLKKYNEIVGGKAQ